MQTVLIIEDSKEYQDFYSKKLENKVNLFQAFSLFEAQKIFGKNNISIDIIALDTWLEEDNSLEFLKEIRSIFSGIIIATSNTSRWRKIFMENGADYEICDKFDLPDLILEII